MGDPEEAVDGVQLASSGGTRSSQRIGKEIFSDAVAAVDEDLARRILAIEEWRKEYLGAVRDVVVAGASSPKAALTIATNGLDSMSRHLTFIRDGEEVGLNEATDLAARVTSGTGEITGQGDRIGELSVPYKGARLSGEPLRRELDRWAHAGIIEQSTAAAFDDLIRNPDWLDLTDQRFVLLGAASQMGPLAELLSWGAQVAAIDLPGSRIWDRIARTAREGSGRLSFPTRGPARSDADAQLARAGADLLTELPEVAEWVRTQPESFVLGNYVYADGATFLRVAGAADALIENTRANGNLDALAYLATPTDVFAVPGPLADEVRARSAHRGRVLKFVSGGRLYAKNYSDSIQGEEATWGISDCLVPIQGPNYALAKSLQRWRAIATREDEIVCSANVAPATKTTSVTKNRMLAAAYSQAHRFGIEIFEADTSRALMAALLVHDLRSSTAAANPDARIGHPYDLFVDKAAHGGIWRSAYEPRSVLPIALLRGMLSRSRP